MTCISPIYHHCAITYTEFDLFYYHVYAFIYVSAIYIQVHVTSKIVYYMYVCIYLLIY